jgi:dynein heavy chain
MQRLNSITEHFQSEQCQQLVQFLSNAWKRSGDRHGTKIPDLLRKWKQIDVSVTEASNESKDNIKYLSSLQRFVGPLYNGTVQGMTDAIPALINSVKVSA